MRGRRPENGEFEAVKTRGYDTIHPIFGPQKHVIEDFVCEKTMKTGAKIVRLRRFFQKNARKNHFFLEGKISPFCDERSLRKA